MNRKIPFQPIFSLMMLLLLFSRQPKATESRSSQPPTHNLPPSPIRRKPHKLFWVCVNHIIILCVPPVSYMYIPPAPAIVGSNRRRLRYVPHNFNGLALFYNSLVSKIVWNWRRPKNNQKEADPFIHNAYSRTTKKCTYKKKQAVTEGFYKVEQPA